LFTYFCIPDVHGRTLEEIEELFAMNIPLRQFRNAKTTVSERAQEGEKAAKEDEEVTRVTTQTVKV
jgi:MFS transporter, SP family, sugar:H+ symporter